MRTWLISRYPEKSAFLANLKMYIDGVVGHYKGRIKAWDVVNEAISDKDGEYLRPTPALKAIGDDYVTKAFEFAHAADPKAELYYNDYNIEQPTKLAKTIRLVRTLQSKGVHIDAVGIQGHWLINWPPVQMIGKGIDAVAATGVKVMITELDVDVLPRSSSARKCSCDRKSANPYPHELPPAMYRKARQALWRNRDDHCQPCRPCTMIGFWGTHGDGRSLAERFSGQRPH